MIPPRITVLDGFTINPGDLSWDALRAIGPCDIYDRTPPKDVISRCSDVSVVLTNKTPIPEETIQALPAIRYIGVMATGYNIVDVAAAHDRGITVSNVPGYCTGSVAQQVFALLLELTRHVGLHAQSVREGEWALSPDFCYWKTDIIDLNGLKLGLVGSGRIAKEVAAIGRAFGMEVLFASRTGGRDELRRVLQESDVLSLHCPLTPDTREMINSESLQLMKRSAFLINTGRGQLIQEADLAGALNESRLAGAGLDVLSSEPPPSDHPLLRAKNCIITPHFAWASRAARQRLMDATVANVRDFLTGSPSNVV